MQQESEIRGAVEADRSTDKRNKGVSPTGKGLVIDSLARLQPVMVQPWRIVERPGRLAIVRRGPVEPRTGMDRQRMPVGIVGLDGLPQVAERFFRPATVLECILVLAGQAPQGVIRAVPHGAVRADSLGPLDIENGFAGLAPPSGRNCRNEPLRLNRVQPPVQCLEVGRVQAFEVPPEERVARPVKQFAGL